MITIRKVTVQDCICNSCGHAWTLLPGDLVPYLCRNNKCRVANWNGGARAVGRPKLNKDAGGAIPKPQRVKELDAF